MKLKIKNNIIFALFISNINLPVLANASYFNNELSSIDSYNFSKRNIDEYKTEIIGSMSTNIKDYSAVSMNNNIYTVGGYTTTPTYTQLNELKEYNTKKNEWATKSPMNNTRDSATVVASNNKIYIMGGKVQYQDTNILEVYDSALDRWEIKAQVPTDVGHYPNSVVVDNKIYLMGGKSNSTGFSNKHLYVYDIASDRWEKKADMPTEKNSFGAIAIRDKIYTFGGESYVYDDDSIHGGGSNDRNSKLSEYSVLDNIEVYDIRNNTWSTVGKMPIKTHSIYPFILNDLICFKYNKTLYMYDAQQGNWSTKENFFISTGEAQSVVIGGKIYHIGGEASGQSNVIEVTYKEEPMTEQEERAEEFVEIAISSGNVSDISTAREMVNSLPESETKWRLQRMLDDVFSNMQFNKGNISANLDVYIKSENMLSMSLDTNTVNFENYSGVADIVKDDAIKITVNSSLPYKLNVFMPSKITNANGTEEMDMNLFNIRESSESTYKQFANNTDPILLKDGCINGNGKVHYIDLKLGSNQAHKADIYKTVLKFEVEQR